LSNSRWHFHCAIVDLHYRIFLPQSGWLLVLGVRKIAPKQGTFHQIGEFCQRAVSGGQRQTDAR
jgi:hypothetical protein